MTLNIGKDDNLAGILQLAVPQAHVLLLQEVTLSQEDLNNLVTSRGTGLRSLGVKVLWALQS